MKFAVISDIHGNLPALDAVIADAEKENVSGFIFAGDYCIGNPWPDECIARICALERKYAVRGNEELYLKNLVGKDPRTWTDGQMQVTYWCFRQMRPEHLDYVLSLPAAMDLDFDGMRMHIAHSSQAFIGECEHKDWSCLKIVEKYGDTVVTPELLQTDMRRFFDGDAPFQAALSRLENGVYIFGHTHVQWCYASPDGKKLILNPGSCGQPLDGIADSMPYALLTVAADGSVSVQLRRVPFDKNAYLVRFRQSGQWEAAHVWSQLVEQDLLTAREHTYYFLRYVEEYAREIGDRQRPFSVPTWEQAFARWQGEDK